jgi:cohesin loading factor subunit SCC2
MAENFSAFDYKTQEEVLTVIKTLTSSLSTTGMQLLGALAPNGLLNELMGNNQMMTDGMVQYIFIRF